MSNRIEIDATTGETRVVSATDQEIADQEARRQADAADRSVEQSHEERVSGSMPASAILTKLRDGTALTAGELQMVVRHLALRAIRETRG